MNVQDFLAIGVVGAAMSVVMQYLKTTSGLKSKMMAVGLSVVVGTAYVFVRDTSWFPTVLEVLATASTVYALFLTDNK